MASRESEFKTLTEVGMIGRGKSKHRPRNDPDLYGGDYPFVQTGDVKHAPFYLTEFTQTYNEKGLAQSKLWPSGTLCITIAANIADTAILGIPACFPDSILGFTPKQEKADVRYVKYCLDAFRAHMEQISKGTTQDNLSMDKLLKLKFWFPDIDIQQKIAGVLTTYDDLIANNQRRIALLESMAEEIYREWFVRMRFPGHLEASTVKGLPVGWTLKRLSDVASINAHSIRRGAEPEFIAYLDISAVGTNNFNEPVRMKFTDAPGRARRLALDGDMIWSSVRPGNKTYCLLLNLPDDLVVSTGFAVISPKPGMPFSYLSKAVTTQEFTDQMVTLAKGAAYPATSFDDFAKAQIVWPTDKLLADFHGRTAPMLQQVALLRDQSFLLAKQRDAILPRLISGKLRVDQLDIEYPPSMKAELEQAA